MLSFCKTDFEVLGHVIETAFRVFDIILFSKESIFSANLSLKLSKCYAKAMLISITCPDYYHSNVFGLWIIMSLRNLWQTQGNIFALNNYVVILTSLIQLSVIHRPFSKMAGAMDLNELNLN